MLQSVINSLSYLTRLLCEKLGTPRARRDHFATTKQVHFFKPDCCSLQLWFPTFTPMLRYDKV